MGADLCGYLVEGPVSLDPQKVLNAINLFTQVRQRADGVLTDGADAKTVSEILRDRGEGARYSSLIFGDPTEAQLDLLEQVVDAGPDFVNEFVGLWEGKIVRRDFSCRRSASDADVQLAFAGERSGGDGPEPSSAWWMFMVADVTGVLEALEIA